MSRSYFRDLVNEPLAIQNSLVTLSAATDTIIFQAGQIAIQNTDVRPGKVWKLTSFGLCTSGSASVWTFTPRWGQLLTSPSLGTGVIQVTAPTVTAVPYVLELWAQCRTLGLGGGANSSVGGTGRFTCTSTGAVNLAWVAALGAGAAATFDISTANICGLQLSINCSVTSSITPGLVIIEALN